MKQTSMGSHFKAWLKTFWCYLCSPYLFRRKSSHYCLFQGHSIKLTKKKKKKKEEEAENNRTFAAIHFSLQLIMWYSCGLPHSCFLSFSFSPTEPISSFFHHLFPQSRTAEYINTKTLENINYILYMKITARE